MSGMVSISERVLELTEEGPRLRGARCTNCGTHVFPAQSGCARCAGASMAPAYLGTEGRLWAWTVQGFPPRSPPYLGPTVEASRVAFEQAGVGPEDVDVAQLQDTESGAEIVHMAENGFCAPGISGVTILGR